MIYYFSGYGEGKNYIEKILYPGFKSPVEFLLQAFSGIHILCGLSFFSYINRSTFYCDFVGTFLVGKGQIFAFQKLYML